MFITAASINYAIEESRIQSIWATVAGDLDELERLLWRFVASNTVHDGNSLTHLYVNDGAMFEMMLEHIVSTAATEASKINPCVDNFADEEFAFVLVGLMFPGSVAKIATWYAYGDTVDWMHLGLIIASGMDAGFIHEATEFGIDSDLVASMLEGQPA
jgi:hypothetical protein